MKPETSEKIQGIIKGAVMVFSLHNRNIVAKVEADKELALTRVKEHILLIINMLKAQGVIDDVLVANPMGTLGVCENVVCFRLKKNGHANFVMVYTDGERIDIKDGTFEWSNEWPLKESTYPVENVDEFNWLELSRNLLRFIYTVIYNVDVVTAFEMVSPPNVPGE